ncbi:bacteriohemerythrin [Desulfobacula phenolica]|uniref:Hemerythrin n=1 Tax=Desulfobacula phenolica TaxID=90732 RepID=A0A1H2JFS4_9BACT|nr:bacteriohemerythrin [Desulfobacula phenolica]SDU54945.1 hemerythrin [Desulfobacula phenolica]
MTLRNDENSKLQNLIQAYERFVPHEFLNFLGKKDITNIYLGDQIEKNMTVLFTDIRDFTSLSEELTPSQNFSFINSYLSCMEPVISEHHGIIDKYIGDAIMALFPTSADEAIACSNAMLATLNEYNKTRQKAGDQSINIGIGLNTGLLILGTIGGKQRMEGTVIGDSVNLAARMESMTKTYGVSLLISEQTFYSLKNPKKFSIRFLDRVMVKGKIRPQTVYEVFDMDSDSVREGKKATLKIFEEALAHYHYKNITDAKSLLCKCLKLNPDDKPARLYLERCDAFQRTGAHESTGELSSFVEWTNDFQFGVPKIDEHHQDLFQLSNELMMSIFKGEKNHKIDKVISFLDEYIITHFRYEENLMRNYEYPFIHFQREQHQKFIQQFIRFKQEIRILDNSNRNFILFRLQVLLVDWLANHILKTDKHLGRYIKRKKASPH